MRLLAADTSTPYCSVSVCESSGDDAHVLCETTGLAGRRHSEILLTLTQDALKQAGLTLHDIDLLAISAGPGSFTGLRVGVATWKGLAFGARKPLVAVPTLDAMSRRICAEGAAICPMLDARMDEVFLAVYEVSNGTRSPLVDPLVAGIEAALACVPDGAVVFGDGALRYRDAIEAAGGFTLPAPEFHFPSAACVAFEAADRVARGSDSDPGTANPIYIRKTYADAARKLAESPAP